MDPGEGNGEKRALDGEDLVSNKKLRKNRFQVRVLQDAFYGAQHPSAAKKAELADQTGLTFEQVQTWFANRRAYDSCRPWQREPSDENSIDDPMEGNWSLTASTSGTQSPPPSDDIARVLEKTTLTTTEVKYNKVGVGPIASSYFLPSDRWRLINKKNTFQVGYCKLERNARL